MSNKRILLSVLMVAALAFAASAQSQDRDNPTPLASNTIKGTGTGKKVEYYYGFTAGPGEVVVTMDLRAKASSTSGEVEVFDEDASKIFYYYPNATSQNERAVKRVNLSNKQALTLRLAFDNNAGDYAIKLTGPVELANSAPPTSDSIVSADTSSSTAKKIESATETPQPDPSSTTTDVPTDASTSKPGKVSKLDFGTNILQAISTQFGLPTSGILHLVMRDGTTQEIDLSKVKSAKVAKQ